MKYTLPKSYVNAGTQVEIPESTLKELRRTLGDTKSAINKWLLDNGYMGAAEYEAFTAESPSKPRATKKRELKIDVEKAAIVSYLYNCMVTLDESTALPRPTDLEIANPNRLISFTLGSNKYELTLTKKKK